MVNIVVQQTQNTCQMVYLLWNITGVAFWLAPYSTALPRVNVMKEWQINKYKLTFIGRCGSNSSVFYLYREIVYA